MIMKVLTITTMITMMNKIKTKTKTNIQQKMLLLIYQEAAEITETIKIITTNHKNN